MTSALPLLFLVAIAGLTAGALAVYALTRAAIARANEQLQQAQQGRAAAEARLNDQEQRHHAQVEIIAQQLKAELHEANARVAEMQRA